MKFSSSGTMSRTSRKIRRKSVSARTEACELRALLSASAISVGAVDSVDLPINGGADASAKIDAAETGSTPEAPIDPDFTDIMPRDPGFEDAIFYCGVTDGDFGIPVDDFSEFNGFFTIDDPGAVDETYGGELSVGEEVNFEDAPPIEGWDPSWLYRTLTSVEGDGSQEIIVDEGTGWEDGLGCGVAPDGFVPGDLAPNDFDGDGVPDEFEMYAFDPLPVDEYQDVPVDVIYFGGLYFEPVDGEVAVEVDKPAADPGDEVEYLFDQVELEDVSGEPVDVVEDGELVPIRTIESSDFDPAVIFYSAAAGGGELQRTNDDGGVHEESATASTIAIPVRPNTSNSLFNAESGRSLVGLPIGLQTPSTLGSNSGPAKRNTTQRRLSTQVAATRPSVASEGLDSLTPLLGGETGPGENDSSKSSVGPQEFETESVEETVSDGGNAFSGASGFAVLQNFSARNARTAMIDRVMAQYAENSFNG